MKKIYNVVDELMAFAGDIGLDELTKIDDDKVGYLIEQVIISVAEKVKEGENGTENIIDELKVRYNNSESFWEGIKNNIDNILVPYREMTFFRNLEISKQNELVELVFDHTVLHLEDPTFFYAKKDIDIEEIKCISKLLNTVSKLIVERNVTKQYFHSEMHDLAYLDEDIIEIIWNLYQNNIEQLRYNQLFKYLKRHDEEIKRLAKKK